jgi:DNA-binding beta-propeller fold protein YncE
MLVAVALVAVATPLPAAAVTPVATQIEYRWTSATPEPSWLMDGAVHAAVDASGNVYVADTGNSRVQKYAATGRLLKQWGALGYGDGQFDHPTGIAVSPNGKNVYVADTGNNRVQHFDANGTFISRWGRIGGPDLAGSGDGEFNAPSGVAVGPDSKVYVVDKNNARVQRFDAAGKFVSKWGSPGSSDGFFLNPSQIAIDSSGAVYVTDTNCYRVQKFTPGGTFVLKWGAYDRFMVGKGLFRKPIGVAVDRAGHVLVADESTRWIQVFDTHGTWLNQWGGIYNRFDAGFVKPGGAACDPKGNFLIADTAKINAFAYSAAGNQSPVVEAAFHKRPNDWTVKIDSKYSYQYTGGGDEGLIDGIRGTVNFASGEWQGYQGQDLVAVVDLQRPTEIHRLGGGFLQDARSWIWMPTRVEFELSEDNQTWHKAAEIKTDVPLEDMNPTIRDFVRDIAPTKARYIRVTARNIGKIPAWHPGAGGDAWIFVDEISVN